MAQSLAKIFIHLVFSTKGRTDTIPKANLADVHAYIAEIFNSHVHQGPGGAPQEGIVPG